MRAITAENIVKYLQNAFTFFGYPNKIRSDNGPQFTTGGIAQYQKDHNIE